MTPTTMYVETTIPAGMTIDEYRRARVRVERRTRFAVVTFLWSLFGLAAMRRR